MVFMIQPNGDQATKLPLPPEAYNIHLKEVASMEIQKQYEELRKKHGLPPFEDINRELEITNIDEKNMFLLREIRRNLVDRIEHFEKMLQEILQPDTNSFRSMSECREFKESEKHELFNIYKNLMIMLRSSQIIELECDDKKEAAFIKSAFENWMRIKKEISPYISKLEKSWEKETEPNEDIGYLG